jgi:hypothetical protein
MLTAEQTARSVCEICLLAADASGDAKDEDTIDSQDGCIRLLDKRSPSEVPYADKLWLTRA